MKEGMAAPNMDTLLWEGIDLEKEAVDLEREERIIGEGILGEGILGEREDRLG